MKKTLLTISALLVGALALSAQNDTTLVRRPVRFEIETFVSNKGNTKETLTAVIDGKTYPTTKSALKRHATTLRYGGTPNVAIVTNRKTKSQKVIVL